LYVREKCEKYVREDKSVAVDPLGVLWVEGHELVEHDVGHRSHAHRGTRMAGVGLKGGIDLQKTCELVIDTLYTRQHAAAALLRRNCGGGGVVVENSGASDTITRLTYREGSDGVDSELVDLSVRHNGQTVDGRRLERGGSQVLGRRV
jgi:hypothetical protein